MKHPFPSGHCNAIVGADESSHFAGHGGMVLGFLTLALVRALEALTSAVRGKPVATRAGIGGFAGGLFEDRLGLD